MKPLDKCANGCGVPPSPPSLVICRACINRIGRTLAKMAGQEWTDTAELDGRAEAALEGGA